MNKRRSFLCIFLCISLCACQGADSEEESASEGTKQRGLPGEELAEGEMAFLEKYKEVFAQTDARRTALIYLDDDSVPELLILKDGEYHLYSFDGSETNLVSLPETEMKANAYGVRYGFEMLEDTAYQVYYWFEYVPCKGLFRIHGGDNRERHDSYLRYEDGMLKVELETSGDYGTWNTYGAEGEITNEEFLFRLADLGYDGLSCCEYLYRDVETAYENIGKTSNSQRAIEDFISGKTEALEYVEEQRDIPEEGFFMRSYEDFYKDITAGEPWWGKTEYADFDNDGEAELIMYGYANARLYFDVVGDTVYKVLKTGSATDVSYVAELDGKQVVVRTDLTHAGRKSYRVMTYDRCCCLTDWFHLYAGYEEADYGTGDRFEYRNRAISMEEFEAIRDSIR